MANVRRVRRLGALDQAEAVALVARARRGVLLGIHRHRLTREELEDCYSQATLEMVVRARGRGGFASRKHIANALEQRFLSRVQDRFRAMNGRSPIETALIRAVPLATDVTMERSLADRGADVERTILARQELLRIAELSHKLSCDQRLVLASRLSNVPRAEFCRTHDWSVEKYRKVIQRARARLRKLLDDDAQVASGEQRASSDLRTREQAAAETPRSLCPLFLPQSEQKAGTHL
ncbi:MAG: hypothetical protein ACRDJ3_06995 [Solirubrobacteraceae bacterium]